VIRFGTRTWGLFALIVLGFTSCELRKTSPDGPKVVARVYAFELAQDELESVLPAGISGRDSVDWVQRYLKDWAAQKALVHTAQKELPLELQKFEKEIELYHHTLLTYAFEERYLAQHLDTLITDAEVAEFHAENPELFLLQEPLMRARWLAFSEGSEWPTDLRQLERQLKSNEPGDLLELSHRCEDAGIAYDLEAEMWRPLSFYQAQLPITDKDISAVFRSRNVKRLHLESRGLIWVRSTLNAGDPAPTARVADRIRELITHRRRKRTLVAMREELVRSAQAENAIDILP
jgi:hypothetical protein